MRYYGVHSLGKALVSRRRVAFREDLVFIGNEFGIKTLDDWHQVKHAEILDRGGRELLKYFGGSLQNALVSLYPNYEWKPWLFEKIPRCLWSNLSNRRNYMKWIAQELFFKCSDDFYRLERNDLEKRGGRGLLALYKRNGPRLCLDSSFSGNRFLLHSGDALQRLLVELFPEYHWRPWRFSTPVPVRYWFVESHVRDFLEWFRSELSKENEPKSLKISSATSLSLAEVDGSSSEESYYEWWYGVKVRDFIRYGGGTLLNQYGGSLQRLLFRIYPNMPWKPWLFERVPSRFWNKRSHREEFVQWLAKRLKVTSEEHWYRIRVEEALAYGAGGLLDHYGSSLQRMLQDLLPNYHWKPWLFGSVPRGFWNQPCQVASYLRWLSTVLNISQSQAWTEISSKQIALYGGSTLLSRYHLAPLLNNGELLSDPTRNSLASPNDPMYRTTTIASKSQLFLFRLVRQLFPNAAFMNANVPLSDYGHPSPKEPRQSPHKIGNPKNATWDHLMYRRSMELDVYIPEVSLAFEYQGGQHYYWTNSYGNPKCRQRSDRRKIQLCEQFGITLIIVPYWWDMRTPNLLGEILRRRPDLTEIIDWQHSHRSRPYEVPITEGTIASFDWHSQGPLKPPPSQQASTALHTAKPWHQVPSQPSNRS